MRVIAGGRKSSRTTRLIEMSAQAALDGKVSYIVCASHEQARSIFQKAKEMSLDIPFPISYLDFMNRSYGKHHTDSFLIDNADHLLQGLTTVDIEAIVVEAEDTT